MVCIMNEALELEVGLKVLEIGAGSGYHACTVAEIVAPSDVPREKWGHVWTIEIVFELYKMAEENVRRNGYSDRVTVVYGDGSLGYPENAPYDRILVTAAAPEIPDTLIEQLKIGGIIVIPIGVPGGFQELVKAYKRSDGAIETVHLGGVAFVPLRGRKGWRGLW